MASFTNSANCFLESEFKTAIFAPNPTTTRGAGVHLNCHPKEPHRIIYASGRSIVVKNILDPKDCFVYRGHNAQTTIAKFSPSGMFVASADVSGKVRIWSWTHKERLLKLETSVFAGAVRDLDWDFENKKIVAVGEGRGNLAKVFMWDTGNSTGEMPGHTKPILSCAFKPSRPMRIATCSEDFKTIFYAGPPFKLDHSMTKHTNFVNCLRYSPDGNTFATCGTDKKIQFYDGKSGEPLHWIDNAHASSIFSVAYSPDNSKIVTVSSDKSLKVWSAADGAPLQNVAFPNADGLGGMLVGCIWTPNNIIVAVSLDGTLFSLDVTGEGVVGTPTGVSASQGAITSILLDSTTDGTLVVYTGSSDGGVVRATMGEQATGIRVTGTDKRSVSSSLHAGPVVGIARPFDSDPDTVVSAGWDNCLKTSSIDSLVVGGSTALDGQPRGLATSPRTSSSAKPAAEGELIAVASATEIVLLRGASFEKIGSLGSLGYQPTCLVLFHEAGGRTEISVGGTDMHTHIYNVSLSVDGAAITETQNLQTRSAVSSLCYTRDGSTLAVGDVGRQIEVFQRNPAGTMDNIIKGKWVFHTSKVTALAFAPSGDRLASGGIDENLFIWSLSKVDARLLVPFSHNSGVTALAWSDDESLVSAGADGCVVTWKIPALDF